MLAVGMVPSDTPLFFAQFMPFSYQVAPPDTSYPSMRARMVMSMARVVL